MIRDLPKILFCCVCAIVVGVFLAKQVKADGYGPGQTGGYKDEPAAYTYSHRPQGVAYRPYRAVCDPHLTKYECRRFREKMAERANGGRTILKSREQAYYGRLNSRKQARIEREERYYDRPVRRKRYAEAGRHYSDADYRSDRSCKPSIEISGRERGGRARASESAYNAWRVEASNRWGYRFSNIENARGTDLDCNPVRKSFGIQVYVCSVRARPCSR